MYLARITNLARSTIIAKNSEIAQTWFKRAKGLLGRTHLENGQALIIRHCDSVHTFFMKFPIDVIFVDKQNYVLKAIENIKPFRLSPIVFGSNFVIELPIGAIKSSRTQKGDQLRIEPV